MDAMCLTNILIKTTVLQIELINCNLLCKHIADIACAGFLEVLIPSNQIKSNHFYFESVSI